MSQLMSHNKVEAILRMTHSLFKPKKTLKERVFDASTSQDDSDSESEASPTSLRAGSGSTAASWSQLKELRSWLFRSLFSLSFLGQTLKMHRIPRILSYSF